MLLMIGEGLVGICQGFIIVYIRSKFVNLKNIIREKKGTLKPLK